MTRPCFILLLSNQSLLPCPSKIVVELRQHSRTTLLRLCDAASLAMRQLLKAFARANHDDTRLTSSSFDQCTIDLSPHIHALVA
jgi:hypothetical protein